MGDAGTDMPRSLAESLENTKVDYVQLGASGLRVSIPILGAMSFGKLDLHFIYESVIMWFELLVTFPFERMQGTALSERAVDRRVEAH